MRHGNRISANVLRDTSGFARSDVRLADDIKQACLAVVHVPHDGDDRRARLELFRLVLEIQLDFLLDRVNHAGAALAFFGFKPETVFRAEPLGDFVVNGLVHVRKNTQFHQVCDDLERFLLQRLGERTHEDGRLDGDDLRVGRQGDFWLLRRGGFCFASRRRSLASVTLPLTLPSRILPLWRGLARRRLFARTASFAATRRRARGQLDKSDLVANLRPCWFWRRWRWWWWRR